MFKIRYVNKHRVKKLNKKTSINNKKPKNIFFVSSLVGNVDQFPKLFV